MKYVAFDFDGTLVKHTSWGIGDPIKKNIDLLKNFFSWGTRERTNWSF